MKIIPFSPPDITELEIAEVVEALRSGWITTGARTKKFENMLAEYVGTNKCVSFNSATAAMELCLRILGVGAGDEVIVPAYTYTASASVIDHVGAKIVMIDTAKDSFEMDYEQLANAITERTKVIIPVDIGGRICDYERIYEIIESKKPLFTPANEIQKNFGRIILLSDSAHGLGAKCRIAGEWKRSGEVADFTSFSFHAVKNLTTAEGGAITWKSRQGIDDEKLYKDFLVLGLHGQNKDAFQKNAIGGWEYDIGCLGYKCNMTDIAAAMGIKQLERYQSMLDVRRRVIGIYDGILKDCGIDTLSHSDSDSLSSGHLYLARVQGVDEQKRNEIIVKMGKSGITCNVHYKPLPMMTAYKNIGFDIKDYPNAFLQYQNEVTLPLHSLLDDDDAEFVANTFRNVVKEVRGW